MDVNELLARLRKLVVRVFEQVDKSDEAGEFSEETREFFADAAPELAQKFDDLDGWLGQGGFIPDDWNKKRK